MKDIPKIIECLERSPDILEQLMGGIPENLRKQQRIPGKMTIHEHAYHIVDVQTMLTERFRTFIREPQPEFVPYFPDQQKTSTPLNNMDLQSMLEKFHTVRRELVDLIKDQPEVFWNKEGLHPEYHTYTPHILLRHILMHEHLHMFRIEELWLTTEKYL